MRLTKFVLGSLVILFAGQTFAASDCETDLTHQQSSLLKVIRQRTEAHITMGDFEYAVLSKTFGGNEKLLVLVAQYLVKSSDGLQAKGHLIRAFPFAFTAPALSVFPRRKIQKLDERRANRGDLVYDEGRYQAGLIPLELPAEVSGGTYQWRDDIARPTRAIAAAAIPILIAGIVSGSHSLDNAAAGVFLTGYSLYYLLDPYVGLLNLGRRKRYDRAVFEAVETELRGPVPISKMLTFVDVNRFRKLVRHFQDNGWTPRPQ